MIFRKPLIALFVSMSAISAPAYSQATGDEDVLVLRRTVSPPRILDGSNGSDDGGSNQGPTYDWVYGEWTNWTPDCSVSSNRQRTVECRNLETSETVEDSQCNPDDRERQSETREVITGCTYDWEPEPWSDWNSQCDENATRTRVTYCMRSDGQSVNTGYCDPEADGARTQETENRTEGCGASIKNGGFEDGLSNWIVNGGQVEIVDDGQGGNAARFEVATVRQDITDPIPAGSTVTISLDCKSYFAGNNRYYLSFRAQGLNTADRLFCESDTWERFNFTYSIDAEMTNFYLYFYPYRGGSAYVDIDNISISVN